MMKKNKGIIIILIGSFLVILLGIYFTFFGEKVELPLPLTPSPKPLDLPGITAFSPTEGESFIFKPQFASLSGIPGKVKVYKISPQKHSAGVARLWANKFGFSGDFSEDTGVEYLYFREKAFFSYNYQRGMLQFTADYAPSGVPTSFPLSFFTEKALKISGDLSLFSEHLDVKIEAVNFYTISKGAHGVSPVSSLQDAEFVEVELTPYLDSHPIVYDIEPHSLSQLQLSLSGELIGLNHRFFSSGGSLGSYPLKDQTQLRESLNYQTEIVSLSCEGCEFDWGTPEGEINVTQLEGLAYLLSSKSESLILQPIFILNGRGEFKEGKSFQTRLYLPAINNKFIK